MLRQISNKSLSLGEISKLVDGELCGDSNAQIVGISSLEDPRIGSISFTRERNPLELRSILERSSPAAVLIFKSSRLDTDSGRMGTIKVEDPFRALLSLVPHFFVHDTWGEGISAQAAISSKARIGKNVKIGPFVSIGDNAEIEDDVVIFPQTVIYPRARIGAGSIIHSGCVVREDCQIGAQTILQNGAIVGADGFGYVPDAILGICKVPQIGKVVLGRQVEIGANTCIDRGALGTTSLGDGCKVDNQVQIGHNVQVGTNTIICAQTGIAGSCRIGNQVTIGGQVGIADHCSVSDGIRLGAGTGVLNDVTKVGDYLGIPAMPAHTWRKWIYAMRIIPTILTELKALKRERKADE